MDKTLSYVKARVRKEGGYEIQQTGVERQGAMGDEDFVRRLQSIGLKGARVHVMLRPDQYQLLQIEAPGVAPEELRAAARYQIRDMLDVHVDDITLDVMRVGDGKQKGTPHLFVVAAANATLRQALDLGQSMGWDIPVIDVQETAQRNLQNALASRNNLVDRAHAALVLGDEHQAVLTISANEELFYSRRIELPSVAALLMRSKMERASRKAPSAFCATMCRASSSATKPSLAQMFWRGSTMSPTVMRRKSKIWQRDRIVGMILCFSVVAKIKMA